MSKETQVEVLQALATALEKMAASNAELAQALAYIAAMTPGAEHD